MSENADGKRAFVEAFLEAITKPGSPLEDIVRRHVDRYLPTPAELDDRIDRAIGARWDHERRRLFLAGAEWAQQFILEMPREFYKQADAAAAEALEALEALER